MTHCAAISSSATFCTNYILMPYHFPLFCSSLFHYTDISIMPRLRRSCVVNRRRRVQHRIDMNQRRQAGNPAAPVNHDPPVIAAVNDLAGLRLQHPVANAPMPQGAQQPHLPQQDVVIQLPAPHCLGDMNNRCPHFAAKYFQEECNA